jgi:pimeloyl-ACP methyl ester carboxylesterase
MREDFTAEVEGGVLSGVVRGDGPPVVLLHGGPGLSWTYLEPLVDELATGYRVAVYQQRGLAPSTAGAPYDVTAQVADVVAVLDHLRWERALVVGHSWGGHLLLHVLAIRPERVTAALIVDTLGGVGDGGEAEFDDEILRRTPPRDVERVEHLERQAMGGNGTEADLAESMRLLWPAYFANPAMAPPFPGMRFSVEAYAETFASLHAEAGAGRATRARRRADAVPARRRQSDAGDGVERHGGGHRPGRDGRGDRRRRALPVARLPRIGADRARRARQAF